MSGGGLSYSGLVNYGTLTLPSVESWGTNMNILRDPPKSIMTRRIDKVGDTSSLTEEIDESGDRIAECISVYARGTNPMVSVEYQNRGNNGGQLSFSDSAFNNIRTGSTQSKLPYGIIQGGAFRPPIKTQEQLFPLSRQPRTWTSMQSLPGYADFSKKMLCPGTVEQTKEVKNNLLKVLTIPTFYKHRNSLAQKPYNTKFNIQDNIKIQAHSGTKTLDIKNQNNQIIDSHMISNPLHVVAQTNQIYPIYYKNNSSVSTDKYIQDSNCKQVNSNISSVKQINGEKMNNLDMNTYIQDSKIIEATAPINFSADGTKYIHSDEQLHLNKNLPSHNITLNKSDNTKYINKEYKNEILFNKNTPLTHIKGTMKVNRAEDPNSKAYNLRPRLNIGGYNINNTMKPSTARSYDTYKLNESKKYKIAKIMQNNR
tara:strand:+ start:4441 stop:5718 length:1278 start_codon:yes stop_codon:yes gene_type:complete